MPELLQVKTDHFELTVWASDISKSQATYAGTLASQQQGPTCLLEPGLRLSAPPRELRVLEELVEGQPTAAPTLPKPLFFENIDYQFEWIFHSGVTDAQLTHRRQLLNAGFRFAAARSNMPARLTGNIQTGNDVGWMRLPLRYMLDGEQYEYVMAFEVLPIKMLLHRDLSAMYHAIDESFPLWRFSLAAKTDQDAASSRQRGNFPLLWLAQFSRLREEFEQGLKVICQAPHSRLQTRVFHTRADRIKGRTPHRLGERVREDIRSKRTERRYRIERKQLSVDTPENRFIKMVVSKTRKQLADFEQRLLVANEIPENQRLSKAFFQELHEWQAPMQKMLDRSFLQEVGDYSGQSRESLVLQQKTGYSSIYRIWQELRLYLDVLAGQSQVSMKSVAEVYEVWCFLRIRQMLLEDLGFEQAAVSKSSLELNEFFEYRLKDGFAGAFEFKRSDGVTARLAHEPRFTRAGETIRSYLITQKPDIVLEVILPARVEGKPEQRFTWLFDAKYRIKTERSQYDEADIEPGKVDFAPDDAINQMHRYRDALIALHQHSADSQHKSRPVFGAFALYPGYFQQAETPVTTMGSDDRQGNNPYADAIREVGIGAFPLLPDDSARGNNSHWLKQFLLDNIGPPSIYPKHIADRLYIQEAARIPVYGMQQALYPDLALTVSLGERWGRLDKYFESFAQGQAGFYHIPCRVFNRRYQTHIVNEIRYLALAESSGDGSASKQINHIWPVKQVVTKARKDIPVAVTGKASTTDEMYYLFTLDKPLKLDVPITDVPVNSFTKTMKLTTLSLLARQGVFSQIDSVYTEAMSHNAYSR